MQTEKLQDFELPEGLRDGAAFAISLCQTGYRKGDFYVGLNGYGFDSHRYLTAANLRELRGWIDEALAKAEA